MRNLTKYPVTTLEVMECLKNYELQAQKEIDEEMLCGDMRPLLLRAAQKIVTRADFVTFDLSEMHQITRVDT